MSFLYPRTIKIMRPGAQSGIGAVGYGGQQPADETLVAKNIAASIQAKKEGAKPGPGLPGDISKRTLWKILFNLPNGTVRDRDIIIDDLGVRYQVMSPYWNSMGYQLLAEKLEV